jgi:hypothetical protein
LDFSVPSALFSDVRPEPQTDPQDGRDIKSVVNWTDQKANYDLSNEISKVYPGIHWIIPHFAISSFPAIFGHFVSDEYLTGGLAFIKSHISDPLAPQLIGIFLLHCFLFRDRLCHIFYQRLTELVTVQSNEQIFSSVSLLAVFVDAFEFCIPYFSAAHIQAVRSLRNVNEQGGIDAVFPYFLLETVQLWRFSPLYTTTKMILDDRNLNRF